MLGKLRELIPRPRRDKIVKSLIDRAEGLGLPKVDVSNAREMLNYNEAGEAFHIVAFQLYEYSIPIDEEFLYLAREAMTVMKIDDGDYKFLNKLVQSKP